MYCPPTLDIETTGSGWYQQVCQPSSYDYEHNRCNTLGSCAPYLQVTIQSVQRSRDKWGPVEIHKTLLKDIQCMGGSGGVQGVRTTLFGPRCRLFNIGPKVEPPPGPRPFFFACRPKMDHPFKKNPGSAPAVAWIFPFAIWLASFMLVVSD